MELHTKPIVEDFIQNLETSTMAKVSRTIDLLEKFQYSLGMPHSKRIGRNIFELRIRGKQEVRLVYTFKDDFIILFYGFIKKSNQINQRNLNNIYHLFDSL
ncbi:MAG: type II toxin-antitoxin system RelE/ParE family toxin [Patescibacteria group bacterium]|jgi:hypothetical protein